MHPLLYIFLIAAALTFAAFFWAILNRAFMLFEKPKPKPQQKYKVK